MKTIAIIGGGLAGTVCAYVLKRAGLTPVIYEAGSSLAGGASGNDLGLYNPRLSAERSAEAEYFIYAFERAQQVFSELPDIDWSPCGALHLITDEKRATRYRKLCDSWGWGEDMARLVDAGEASALAGVTLSHDALYLARSGYVSPRKLCAGYADGVEVNYNTNIHHLKYIEADAVIIASGTGALGFEEAAGLPLNTVRGQVSQVAATEATTSLKTALCYGGYFAPAVDGVHMLGASFQRWLDHADILEQDDADNIAGLAAAVPELADGLSVTNHRAALRVTSKDHFPVVGALDGRPNLYISTAHGSHGILSSLEAAHLLADMILARAPSLPPATIERLSPARYTAAS